MLRPIQTLKLRYQRRWRTQRMRAFLQYMRPAPGARVLDLGGTDELWDTFDLPLDVTLLNTKAAWARLAPTLAGRTRLEGDPSDLSRFSDGAFDIVFSSGAIEQVGDHEHVARFAAEARRVGRGYWIQTPCYFFAIDAHTNRRLFWFHPRPVRNLRWFDREGTRPAPGGEPNDFTLDRLRALFPDAALFTERVAGLPRSWALYRAPVAEITCAGT